MPPKPALREPDRGLRFLEDKLSVYVHGPSQTRRNPALDLLTGRVPDTRLQPPATQAQAPAPAARPATVVLPRVALGVARGRATLKTAPSPWLDAIQPATATPRLRLVAPPPATRSPMTFLAPALAFLVVCAIALGIGLAIRGLRQSDPILVAPATTAPAQPTVAPTVAPIAAPTAVPNLAPMLAPTRPPAPRVPEAPPAPAQADQFRLLLDERFSQPSLSWRNQPGGTTWLVSGAYHLSPRQPGRFVAVGVPGATDLADVVVSGAFTKVDGPVGGGYGLILRDPSAAQRDGLAQDGHFYVFEVGDKGELGIWLRDGDHWVDLLPWTPNDAVHPGRATNELTVSAIGETLAFSVNGIPVATQRDQTLHHGGVALFTGGDNNHVAVDHLTIRVPR